MPSEYMGEYIINGKGRGGGITTPRKWTQKEIDWVLELRENGYSIPQIAESCGRSEVSVGIKIKRIGKSNNTYNDGHILEKNALNDKFIEVIAPKSICDAYCGEQSYYSKYNAKLLTNDINTDFTNANYHLDALKFMCMCYYKGRTFDIVDLDPYGSAYDCLDLAIKMAKKGLIVTLGELGHKRWKRLDYVSRHYGINTIEEFTINNIIKHIQKIGERNKKTLNVWKSIEWKNIGRVYFQIDNIKITEQWGNKND